MTDEKIIQAFKDLSIAENLRKAAEQKYYSAKKRLESLLLSPSAPKGKESKKAKAAAEIAATKYASRRKLKTLQYETQ